MKRTTARALTVASTLALAGAVAGAGTLASSNVANPALEPVAYTITPVTYDDSAALAARTDARATFAERASRDLVARNVAHLTALKAAKKKAARAKAAKVKRAAVHRAAVAKRAAKLANKKSAVRMFAAPVNSGSPRAIAKRMAAARGWTGNQWGALDRLWNAESGWTVSASNSSGAYGIPQSLPGSKMASAGSDWRTNPSTQIEWGLDYIASRWGSPMSAWGHFQTSHWY